MEALRSLQINEPVEGKSTKKILVVGEKTLQNELIISALQDATGISCSSIRDLGRIKPMLDAVERTTCLVLYDCLGKQGKACLADLEPYGPVQDLILSLFNLGRGEGVEKDAVSCGIKGFFYRDEPFSLLVKGVAALLAGELWISRRLLSEMVTGGTRPSGTEQLPLLSEREKDVLSFLGKGATNKDIADRLFISPVTVKNHLGNIFRKINVHDKTHAALWAATHLRSRVSFIRG
jgi:DNA-binding CsgD family transcriptional regulator